MNKVEVAILGNTAENAVCLRQLHIVPADVGHLQSRPTGNAANAPVKDTQTRNAGAFFALGKQQLQPQANTQKRSAAICRRPHRVYQPATAHGSPSVANPGQDHPICRQNLCRIGSNAIVRAQKVQRLLHTGQIPGTVVNNCNHTLRSHLKLLLFYHTRVPGATAPRRRGPDCRQNSAAKFAKMRLFCTKEN